MTSTVYHQKPDERARAFFHALDLYNKSIAEALEEGIPSRPGTGFPELPATMSGGQPADHIPEGKPGQSADPVCDGVQLGHLSKEKTLKESCRQSTGGEEVEAAARAKAERRQLQDRLDEWKVACIELEQNIKAERSRASALKKTIQHVRDELQKILDRRGRLLVRNHRVMEECEDLERQVGEIVGRRGALMAELSRDRHDIRLLKKALATAKAEKIELGRLVSAAKSESRRWAHGIIHRAREAQNESEVRLTNMAVGGVELAHREEHLSKKEMKPYAVPLPSDEIPNYRRVSPKSVVTESPGVRASYHVDGWLHPSPILDPPVEREALGCVEQAESLDQNPAKWSTSLSRLAEIDSWRHSSASSSSCITIPLSGDVG